MVHRILRTLPAGCIALVVIASAGCASAPPVVVQCSTPMASDRLGAALVGQPYGMAMTPLPLNSVQFGSHDVSRALAIQNLYAERLPMELVQVSARFVSCGDEATSVRVRTSFMRASTAPSEPTSAWKTVYLEPRATVVYTENSTNRDAASYLIEIAR